jgi:TonB family protein
MRAILVFGLLLSIEILYSQKLVEFKISECLTNCKFENSTIESLEVTNGSTEILLRTYANCDGKFLGEIEILEGGFLNLVFNIKPIEGVDKKGKKFSIIEVADCDCPFDFTFLIKGLEFRDPSLIRVNGLQLSELPGPLVEEIIVEQIGSEQGGKEKKDENQIFAIVEELAAPVGGMGAFYKYVREEMKYPTQARKMEVEGRVFCEFIVNSDGSIQDVRVIRGIGAGCDEEAIRIIQASTPWRPGKQSCKPVRSKFNVAIIFKLS